MLLPDDPWRSPPRYSLATFEARLREGNPAILAERPASAYYAQCEAYGVDPALLVEKLFKESSGGTQGVARFTKNWGNTGYPHFGPAPLPPDHDQIGLANKRFPASASWLDGLESTLARLVAQNWVYHDRISIAELYEHPSDAVWAPASHFNDPAGYLATVVREINRRADRVGAQTVPTLPYVRDWLISPTRTKQRPGYKLRGVKKITIHETGNPDDGADAEMHAKLLANNPNWGQASWHFTVDDLEAILHIPLTEVAWHAGDDTGPGNWESLGLEGCVNADGNFWVMRRNLAGLAAHLCRSHALGAGDIVQHHHWARVGHLPTHKHCPERMRGQGLWPSFVELAARAIAPHKPLDPPTTWRFYALGEGGGHYIDGGFRAFYDSIPDKEHVFGLPLSEEFRGTDGVTRQVFQKAIFEHRPGWPQWNHWDVYLMNGVQDGVAASALEAAYPEAFVLREAPK